MLELKLPPIGRQGYNVTVFCTLNHITQAASITLSIYMLNLGLVIFRPFSTLRDGPVNVLVRSLDIAGLAVDAASSESV